MKSSRIPALVLAAFAVLAAVAPSQAEQASPVCVYASKNYSEGAFLCVQKSVALTCRSEGARATWTTVSDGLAERCATPEPYRPHPRVRTAFRARHRDLPIESAKCFEFNGRRYCE